tara:strand:+ start:3134 stop:3307 length:174 start_codon:yes stop_codon:yes gene_type:complete
MNKQIKQLSQIRDDLEAYVLEFCPSSGDGKYNDFSGENCNEALLLLQSAIDDLKPSA